jgi:hypothetical protein
LVEVCSPAGASPAELRTGSAGWSASLGEQARAGDQASVEGVDFFAAGAFLAGVDFFAAGAFLAGVFFAAVVFAGVFFAGVFFAGLVWPLVWPVLVWPLAWSELVVGLDFAAAAFCVGALAADVF